MDFTKTFKDYSNTDLLKIIYSPNEYQPQAVETAKTIFASRQLSEEEMEIARAELAIQQKDKEVKSQKKINIENKVKHIGTSLLNNVNPIQTKTATAEKLINPSCYLKKEHRIKNNFELPYLKSFYRCSVKIKLYQFIVL